MTEGFSYPNDTYSYISIAPPLGQFLVNFCDNLDFFLVHLERYVVDTVEHFILGLLCYIVLCIVLYVCITQLGLLSFARDMRNAKRVLFITAHPDDEVMFFGPTIYNYTQKPNCSVYLMCLSSGNLLSTLGNLVRHTKKYVQVKTMEWTKYEPMSCMNHVKC